MDIIDSFQIIGTSLIDILSHTFDQAQAMPKWSGRLSYIGRPAAEFVTRLKSHSVTWRLVQDSDSPENFGSGIEGLC